MPHTHHCRIRQAFIAARTHGLLVGAESSPLGHEVTRTSRGEAPHDSAMLAVCAIEKAIADLDAASNSERAPFVFQRCRAECLWRVLELAAVRGGFAGVAA
jgi:hypothetical protein